MLKHFIKNKKIICCSGETVQKIQKLLPEAYQIFISDERKMCMNEDTNQYKFEKFFLKVKSLSSKNLNLLLKTKLDTIFISIADDGHFWGIFKETFYKYNLHTIKSGRIILRTKRKSKDLQFRESLSCQVMENCKNIVFLIKNYEKLKKFYKFIGTDRLRFLFKDKKILCYSTEKGKFLRI